MSTGNRSIPAGTGVWVVNTVLDRTTVNAVSKSNPDSGDQLADALGSEEPGVALVHVEHLGRGQAFDGGERADRPYPADTGQNLLHDAMFLIAAVQTVGDAAQVVLVLRNVGIQQAAAGHDPPARPRPGPATARSRAGSARPAPDHRRQSVSSRNGSPCGSSDG